MVKWALYLRTARLRRPSYRLLVNKRAWAISFSKAIFNALVFDNQRPQLLD